MTREELEQLTEKIVIGRASDEEIALYNTIYNDLSPAMTDWDEAVLGNRQELETTLLQAIQARTEERRPVFTFYRLRWAAAIGVILLGAGTYVWLTRTPPRQPQPSTVSAGQHITAPHRNHATITLGNGETVFLDSTANGQLAIQENVKLVKLADGKIAYTGTHLTSHVSRLTYNTLTNPRGSKVIHMTLADGSRVWLNAGSSVTYPVAFAAKERKVAVTGEAYFEIEADAARPFKVSRGNLEITVLGTRFNVNAYDDEPDIRITLLEGAVRVTQNAESRTLAPGQQAVAVPGLSLAVDNAADLQQVMAWKEGLFIMHKMDIATIMRQIARWYDVEVRYAGNIPHGRITGDIPNTMDLSDVLKVMELSGLKYRVEGRVVVVE